MYNKYFMNRSIFFTAKQKINQQNWLLQALADLFESAIEPMALKFVQNMFFITLLINFNTGFYKGKRSKFLLLTLSQSKPSQK